MDMELHKKDIVVYKNNKYVTVGVEFYVFEIPKGS